MAARVLVIGLDPYRVPGPWDAEPVARALASAADRFTEVGIRAVHCLVGLDGTDDIPAVVAEALAHGPYDCVLIGGGIRHDDRRLELFEDIVNLVHRHAPGAAIAFNHRPEDVVEAVQRRLAMSEADRHDSL